MQGFPNQRHGGFQTLRQKEVILKVLEMCAFNEDQDTFKNMESWSEDGMDNGIWRRKFPRFTLCRTLQARLVRPQRHL